MVSGGSIVSESATWAATTVTVQVSPAAKSESGLSVLVLPVPLTTAVWLPLLPQEMVNELEFVLTDSLKLTVTFVAVPTPAALSAGVVLETLGGVSVVQLQT
jgi:hypothetical protein